MNKWAWTDEREEIKKMLAIGTGEEIVKKKDKMLF
jgi:hypothetical protein